MVEEPESQATIQDVVMHDPFSQAVVNNEYSFC